MVLDRRGEHSSIPFLFQNPLLMVPFPLLGLLLGLLPLLFSRPLALTPRTRKWKSSNWEMCLLMTLGSIPVWRAILSGSLITLHGWPFLKVSVVLSLSYISLLSLFQLQPGYPPTHLPEQGLFWRWFCKKNVRGSQHKLHILTLSLCLCTQHGSFFI